MTTLGLTSGALEALHGLSATPSRALELAVLVAASAGATITRYVALRSWVFARKRHRGRASRIDTSWLNILGRASRRSRSRFCDPTAAVYRRGKCEDARDARVGKHAVLHP
jgi:hypothetical protein